MQNSAKKRIQNHLAYKLGQAMIHFNKEKKGGGDTGAISNSL
ncbi:sugar transferase [Campylobacter sp. MIT 21-1684]|nr:sugar transferase [Campylobacter sp. MIT 21-1684]MCX2682337.1 sugar transferase [Campylobacter sp. MIT 21-1684]